MQYGIVSGGSMYSKEEIIREIRKVAEHLNVKHLKQQDFILNSTVPINTVKYHLGTWVEAVKAAGLESYRNYDPIENPDLVQDEDLLKELVRLYRMSGTPPTPDTLKAHGAFSLEYYTARWQSLSKAFWRAREVFPDSFVDPVVSVSPDPVPDPSSIRLIPKTIKPKRPAKVERKLGDPLEFRGLRFSPVDRDGVVFLFGMLAVELGFELEFVSSERPHAEGRRYFDIHREQWKHLKVEFIFKSSGFSPVPAASGETCDLLVCWEHDSEDCPVEILELKGIIREISG